MITFLAPRARRSREDTGSMPIALLLTLIGITLSALLAPMLLVQIDATRTDSGRARALHAAQAGLDIGLGHIRAARTVKGDGVLAKLPCGPITGRLGTGDQTAYRITIDYLPADPLGKPGGWVAANRLSCIGGGGPPSTPAYALITAKGTDLPAGPLSPESTRTLQATYTFSTTNQNIPGGLIHVYRGAGSPDLCLDAGSGSPATGTTLQVKPCSAGSPRQTFTYDQNLNLTLASSRTASRPLGLCVDGGSPHAVGNPVQLQPCADTTHPRQQWSYNSAANFEGTSDGADLDGYCLNVQNPGTSGSLMVLGSAGNSTCHEPYNDQQTFSPEAAVGAGAAGADTGQLVNFKEFGRCLDVTNAKVNAKYLIIWPCKQAPDPANVLWNQKWALPDIPAGASSATGTIVTSNREPTDYCLESPLSTASGAYVRLSKCPKKTASPAMIWTVRTSTGSYPTSYTILDSAGDCLSPTDPEARPPDFHTSGAGISKAVVAPCDGSTLQKWNAPPNVLQSVPLKDFGER